MARKSRRRKRVRSAEERRDAEEARRVATRAIRRLDMLEYVILLAAALLALLGGALVAWLIGVVTGFSFRITWAVASLLLFIIPGGSVYLRELRRGKAHPEPGSNSEP